MRFAFPTLGKEPDFVVLNRKDFTGPAEQFDQALPLGRYGGILLQEGRRHASWRSRASAATWSATWTTSRRRRSFYCPCHQGWFDENGKNIAGPPPKPLEIFVITEEGEKLIIAKKGVKVELPKA